LARRISRRISSATFGLPPRGRDFHRQNKRKPARCQRMTVSGLTQVIHRKNEAIEIAKNNPLWRFSSQHIELVAQRQDFGLQRSS
jgi:hypothetical protein